MKTILTSALVALLVAGAFYGLSPSKGGQAGPAGPQGPAGQVGQPGQSGQPGRSGKDGNSPDLSSLSAVLTALQDLLAKSKLGAIVGTQLSNPNCTGELCTEVVSGVCRDATTTLAIVTPNYLTASSTATRVIVNVTNPATTTVRLNVATTTAGSGHMPSAKGAETATTTGLINRATLTLKATTTIDSDTANYLGLNSFNSLGYSTSTSLSSAFPVGPRSTLTDGRATTTSSNKVTIGIVAHGEDSLAGITNTNNLFGCTYSVEFTGQR